MRTSRSRWPLLLVCALVVVGCAPMNPKARTMLQQPARCDNTQGDIQVLEANRAGGAKRVVNGLQAVLPPSAALSLVRDLFIGKPYRSIYLDRWRVAFGSYNRKIDKRVSELRRCPLR